MRAWSSRGAPIAGVALGLGVALLFADAFAQEAPPGQARGEQRAPEANEIEPRAAQVVRRTSDYLGSLPAFRVNADSSTEVVMNSGEKIQVLASSDVVLQRPNKLLSERRGSLRNVTFIYDGDRITLYGERNNLYAQIDAPNDLDAALDFARDRLDLEAPGADLLYTNAYEGLLEGVESGRYVGEAEVDGVVCDHVAFRGEDVDWQLWVERGERPLPRRYVIVTKDQPGTPEFIVQMRDWRTDPSAVAESDFVFRPPEGATEIEFLAEAPRAGRGRALARGELEQGREGAGT